jgi:hypothetical protein
MQMISRMEWHEIHDGMLKFKIHPLWQSSQFAEAPFRIPATPPTESFLRPKGFFENVLDVKECQKDGYKLK